MISFSVGKTCKSGQNFDTKAKKRREKNDKENRAIIGLP